MFNDHQAAGKGPAATSFLRAASTVKLNLSHTQSAGVACHTQPVAETCQQTLYELFSSHKSIFPKAILPYQQLSIIQF
jgi:hypothetical protein